MPDPGPQPRRHAPARDAGDPATHRAHLAGPPGHDRQATPGWGPHRLRRDAGISDGKPHGILALAIADLIADGIPAADALASATSLAAQACGLGGRKGRLHPGYDADLAVVDGDPLADIASPTAVRAVYLGGHAAQPAT